MTAKGKSEAPGSTTSFEDALQRLEKIVETIEKGNVRLDEVMTMYEEGVRLSKSCLEQLTRAEQKLKRLNKDLEGNLALSDPDGDE